MLNLWGTSGTVPASATIDGGLLTAVNGSNVTTTSNVIDVSGGASLASSAVPLIQLDGSSLTAQTTLPVRPVSIGLLNLWGTAITGSPATVGSLEGGLLLAENGSVVSMTGSAINVANGASLTATTAPLLQVTSGANLSTGNDSAVASLLNLSSSSATVTGGLLQATGGASVATSGSVIGVYGGSLDASGAALLQVDDADLTSGNATIPGALLNVNASGAPATRIDGGLLTATNGSTVTATAQPLVTVIQSDVTAGAAPFVSVSDSTVIAPGLVQAADGSQVTIGGPLVDASNGTITLGSSPVVSLSGASSLGTDSGFVTLSGGSLTAGALITTDGTTANSVALGGPLLVLSNGAIVTLGHTIEAAAGDTVTQTLGGQDSVVALSGGSTLDVTAGALMAHQLSAATSAPLVSLAGGSTLTVGAGPAFAFPAGSAVTADSLVATDAAGNSTIGLTGGLLALDGAAATFGTLLRTDPTDTVTFTAPATPMPLVSLANGSSLTTTEGLLSTNGVVMDLAAQPVVRIEHGSQLDVQAGPAFRIVGGTLTADSLISTDGLVSPSEVANSIALTGTVLDLANTTVELTNPFAINAADASSMTVTLAPDEPFVRMASSTLNVTGAGTPLLAMENAAGLDNFSGVMLIASGTATDRSMLALGGPLLTLAGFSFTDTGAAGTQVQLGNTDVTSTGGDNLVDVVGQASLASGLIAATDSSITGSRALLDVSGTLTGGDATLVRLDGTPVTTAAALVIDGGQVTLNGSLLSAQPTDATASTLTFSEPMVQVTGGGMLSQQASGAPLISLTSATLDAAQFLDACCNAESVSLADAFLVADAAQITGGLVTVNGASLETTADVPFISLTGGSSVSALGIDVCCGASATLAGGLLSATDSAVGLYAIDPALAGVVFDGSTLVARSTTAPLISLVRSPVTSTDGGLVAVAGDSTPGAATLVLVSPNQPPSSSPPMPAGILVTATDSGITLGTNLLAIDYATLCNASGATCADPALLPDNTGMADNGAAGALVQIVATDPVNAPVSVSTGLGLVRLDQALVMLDRPLLQATGVDFAFDANPVSADAFIGADGGTTVFSSSAMPFVDLNGGSVSAGTDADLFLVGANSTVNVPGPLLSVANGTSLALGAGNLVHVSGGSLSAGALLQAADVELTLGGAVASVDSAGSLSAAGPILDLTSTTLDLGATGVVVHLAGGSTIATSAGPFVRASGGSLFADSLLLSEFTVGPPAVGNTVAIHGTLLDLSDGAAVTLRTLGESIPDVVADPQNPPPSADMVTFTLTGGDPFINLASASHLTLTGTDRVFSISPDQIGGSVFDGRVLVSGASELDLGGQLLAFDGMVTASSTDALIQLTGTRNADGTTDSVLTQTGIDDLVEFQPTAVAMLYGPLLTAAGTDVTTGGRLLTVQGAVTSQGPDTLLGFTASNVTTGLNLVAVVGAPLAPATATLALNGSLLAATDSTFTEIGSNAWIAMVNGAAVTLDGASPLLSLVGNAPYTPNDPATVPASSTVATNAEFLFVGKSTADPAPASSLTLANQLLVADRTAFTIGSPTLATTSLLFVGDSAVVTGPPAPIGGGDAPALISLTASSADVGGNFLTVRRSTLDATSGTLIPTTLTLSGPLLEASDSTFTTFSTTGPAGGCCAFILMAEGASLASTAQSPLLQFSNSTFPNIGGAFVLLKDSTGAGDPAGPASMSLAGGLLSDVGGVYTVGKSLVSVTNGSMLTSTGTDPLLAFDGSTVDSAGLLWTAAGTVTIDGDFLNGANSGFTTGSGLPWVQVLNGATVTTGGRLIALSDGATLDVNGVLVSVDGSASALTTGGPLLDVSGGAAATTQGANWLISATNGGTITSNDAGLRVIASDASGLAGTSATLTLAGGLASLVDGTLITAADVIDVLNGGDVTSTGTDPLIALTRGTIAAGSIGAGGLLTVGGTGGASVSGASFTLAGELLDMSDGSSIGASADLIAVTDGASLSGQGLGMPLVNVVASTIETTGGGFVDVGDTASVDLADGLLVADADTNGVPSGLTFTDYFASVAGALTTSNDVALVQLLGGSSLSVTGGPFLAVSGAGMVSLAGQLVHVLDSTLTALGGLVDMIDGAWVSSTTASSLVDVVTSGAGPGVAAMILGGADASGNEVLGGVVNATGTANGTPGMELQGPLLTVAGGSEVTTLGHAIELTGGASLTSNGSDALVSIDSSSLTIGSWAGTAGAGASLSSSFLAVSGVDTSGTQSMLSLSGPLLAATDTLGTGTSITTSGDFIEVADGGVLSATTTSTTDSLVELTDSTVTTGVGGVPGTGNFIAVCSDPAVCGVGTASYANVYVNMPLLSTINTTLSVPESVVLAEGDGAIFTETPTVGSYPLISFAFPGGTITVGTPTSSGSLITVRGRNTAPDPDPDPITGGSTGLTLATDQPLQHYGGGALVDMSNDVNVSVTGPAGSGTGHAIVVDQALLEATAPLLKLSRIVSTGTTLATSGSAIDVRNQASLRANADLIQMANASQLIVSSGSLVNVAGGSRLTVGGNLVTMSGGSLLTIVNGLLLNITGGSIASVGGSLVGFSGSNNTINVANTFAPTNYILGVPVYLSGGALPTNVSFTGTPLANLGANNNTIKINGTQLAKNATSGATGSLIAISGATSKLTIGH